MQTLYVCTAIAMLSGILCYVIEKWEKIPLHIDKHHDAALAAITGGVAAFFASLIVILITKF